LQRYRHVVARKRQHGLTTTLIYATTPVQYVLQHLNEKVECLGNELAELIVGPGTTWRSANESFVEAVSYVDPVYGPTKPASG
ncbi:hypothetical protein ACQCRI_24430, partial [Ralstonia pseudosolanacearum]|uniref:hypothetical protein n=1 Tax=Ralstonia pseudosolanacearum TaxID=1310165 RepID=UPI003CE6D199